MRALHDILPIWSVRDHAILSKMGDITIGYSVRLPEIFTLGEAQFASLHGTWVKALRLLPAGILLYKQDWFVQAKYAADFTSCADFLQHSNERHFAERSYLDHCCYLFFTLKPKNRKIPNSAMSTLLRKHLVPAETLRDSTVNDLEGIVEQFVRVIADGGLVSFTRLHDSDLVTSINRYLSLSNDGFTRDIDFSDGIRIGEHCCALFGLTETDTLPATCSSSISHDKYSTDAHPFPIAFVSPIGQLLHCNHLYSQFITVEDQNIIAKKLEAKKLRLQSLSAYSRENAMGREAVNDFLNDAVGGQRQIVRAHFNVLAWTDSKEGLRDVRIACSTALSKMNVRPHIETTGAPQIYWAGIPGNAADLPVNESFLTFSQQACCFLHMEANYRSSISAYTLRLADRLSGMPVDIDLWDEPMRLGLITNRNAIVVGRSGSGKSFYDNHMLHSDYASGAHIVVVDMGNSYTGICEMLDGYYYAYTRERPIALNPFYTSEGIAPDTEKMESLKTLLVALWKKEDESFMRSEYVALSNVLLLYYQREVPFRCFDSFYEFVRDEFVPVLQSQQVKEKEFDVANFLYVMRPFYRGGEFDYLLNASENLDVLNRRLIIFEIDAIKDHPILFPVVTIIIMELFIAKMRSWPGMRKVIVIEEAWKAVAKAGMAEYVKYLFKTVRKYYGKAVVVTQDLDDILSSEIIKEAIINNADIKILLDQSKYQHRFGEIQALLGLPDTEVPKILSMNKANDPARRYKEVYIWPLAKVYGVEVSREAYWCYTTEEREKVAVREAAKKYGNLEKGIRSLAICLVFVVLSICGRAQIPVISEIISKVVKVVDLKVQRLQMEQLWLQHAQKLIENKLHQLRLSEIGDWSQKQKQLYQEYFGELKSVRKVIVPGGMMDSLKRQKARL